jgi:hypothetical protein
VICSAAYVAGLRLYSDDWFFVEPLMTGRDQSLVRLRDRQPVVLTAAKPRSLSFGIRLVRSVRP